MVCQEVNTKSITVCDHPILHHQLAIIRDKHTVPEIFRLAMSRISQIVLQEATQDLPTVIKTIETPLQPMQVNVLDPAVPIIVIPILRAGLLMTDVMLNLIPTAHLYHLGLYRDKKTLMPVTYYNKLTTEMNYENARIFILDPMLATGGSLSVAINIVKELNAQEKNISIAAVIAAPEGIKNIKEHYPEVKIFSAALDSHLNEHAYIVPGLGDAGDRGFRT